MATKHESQELMAGFTVSRRSQQVESVVLIELLSNTVCRKHFDLEVAVNVLRPIQ